MSAPSKAIVTTVEFVVEDRLVICDPCYIAGEHDISTISGGLVIPQAAHTWTATTKFSNRGMGRIVSILRLQMEREFAWRSYLEQIGSVGVDSGQMYAGCHTNLPLDYQNVIAAHHSDGDPSNRESWVYRPLVACEGGAISSTGYGDGEYSVYANSERSLIEVRFDEYEEE